MPRDCEHMPGAAKEVKCPLCKSLKDGGILSKPALVTLNSQPVKPKVRECPRCHGAAEELVTREGELMCKDCAVDLDE